jgi:hypothetical protein
MVCLYRCYDCTAMLNVVAHILLSVVVFVFIHCHVGKQEPLADHS